MTARLARPPSTIGDVVIGVLLPLALAAIAAVLQVLISQSPSIGPFSRATSGWIAIPLLWLAPGIGGLWWARLSPGQSRLAFALLAVAIAVEVALALAATGNRVGCGEVARSEVFLRGLVPGAVLGIGFGTGARLAGATAWWLEGRWAWLPAVVVGGVVGAASFFAALMAWAWVFIAGVSCAPG